MPPISIDSPAPDRLLTPLGGVVLALVVSVTAFWLPALDLVLR